MSQISTHRTSSNFGIIPLPEFEIDLDHHTGTEDRYLFTDIHDLANAALCCHSLGTPPQHRRRVSSFDACAYESLEKTDPDPSAVAQVTVRFVQVMQLAHQLRYPLGINLRSAKRDLKV